VLRARRRRFFERLGGFGNVRDRVVSIARSFAPSPSRLRKRILGNASSAVGKGSVALRRQ